MKRFPPGAEPAREHGPSAHTDLCRSDRFRSLDDLPFLSPSFTYSLKPQFFLPLTFLEGQTNPVNVCRSSRVFAPVAYFFVYALWRAFLRSVVVYSGCLTEHPPL